MIKVSIISVDYNGLEVTCEMIESLRRHVSVAYELIVVDNGSVQNEAEIIKRRYPDVVTLRSEQNLGFAGGNNLGIKIARGEYILLLNNDTEVKDDTLGILCETMDGRPELGVLCPKIRFAAEPCPIQFAGYTPLSRVTLRNSLIGFNQPDDGSYDIPCDTPYAHGAAMLVRRAAIEAAGLMPELFFLYYEELDWSEKITGQGYKIGYEPRSTVYHKESRTTGTDSPLRTFYLTRNRLLFGWRNRRGGARYLTVVYQIGVSAVKNIVTNGIRKRGDLCGATVRGVVAFFKVKNKMA